MVQTYQGYFEKGRFVSPEAITIPERTQVLITILGDEIRLPVKTKGQRQVDALDKFIASVNRVNSEPISDEAFEELENCRVNLGRPLNL
jgi:hypothetical protein